MALMGFRKIACYAALINSGIQLYGCDFLKGKSLTKCVYLHAAIFLGTKYFLC